MEKSIYGTVTLTAVDTKRQRREWALISTPFSHISKYFTSYFHDSKLFYCVAICGIRGRKRLQGKGKEMETELSLVYIKLFMSLGYRLNEGRLDMAAITK